MRFRFGVQNRGREEAKVRDGARNIQRTRERNRLASIDRFGAREFLQIAIDQLSDSQQKARTFGRRFFRPIAKRFLRRVDRKIDIAASLSATCEYGLPVAGSMLSRYCR